MVPIYVSGANMYECGSLFHRSTISYLYDAAALEWLVAVLGCLFTGVVVSTLLILRAKILQDWEANTAIMLTGATAAVEAHTTASLALDRAERSACSSSAELEVLRNKAADPP